MSLLSLSKITSLFNIDYLKNNRIDIRAYPHSSGFFLNKPPPKDQLSPHHNTRTGKTKKSE